MQWEDGISKMECTRRLSHEMFAGDVRLPVTGVLRQTTRQQQKEMEEWWLVSEKSD